ncbi:MAG: hypothetical protein RIC51_00555 [Erythrobacter sp.]|uniref:hypothetical protein n=1 Tax=Erythrobacter sp. TaxID=1042 RepID=UPI0032EF9114
MPRTTTLTDAFAFFGASTHNIRQAWSAVSPDGRTVVITLWDHERAADGSVNYFDPANRWRWERRWGNKERIRHLKHALDNCSGRFRVVRVVAKDPDADSKTIRDRIADPDTVMKITGFDAATGEFAARPV